MKGLSNKQILICGGSKGIGAASVESFLSLGSTVTILSRSLGKFKEHPFLNKNLHHIEVDFSDTESKNKAFDQVKSLNVDILINNAGGPPTAPTLDSDINDFSKAMEIHLYTYQELTKIIVPKMIEKKHGKIVNIISVTATTPLPNFCVSNTLRGALINWSKTLSKEFGQHNITVNNVLPGYTETERLLEVMKSGSQKNNVSEEEFKNTLFKQIPMKRFASPSEVADAVVFLASDHASFINGISIPVDGGWTPCV